MRHILANNRLLLGAVVLPGLFLVMYLGMESQTRHELAHLLTVLARGFADHQIADPAPVLTLASARAL